MGHLIESDQRAVWQRALREARAQATSSQDWGGIAHAIEIGELSPVDYKILQPYYETISTRERGILFNPWSTAHYARTKGTGREGTAPPLALDRFAQIRTQGIQTNADIALSLEYIQRVAPEFGGELIGGYRSLGDSITIVIDSGIHAADGLTEILPVSYYDRNARYPTRIRLKPGASILAVVHELIHALPADLQPAALRERRFPVIDKTSNVSNLRNGAMHANTFEESNAFGGEMIFLEEAQRHDPGLPLNGDDASLSRFFQGAGSTTRERLDALQRNLPILMPWYTEQAKISSIIIALAGKTGNERNSQFGPAQLINSILGRPSPGGTQGNQVDAGKALAALYTLLNAGGANQALGLTTLDSVMLIARGTFDEALDTIVSRMELTFDGAQFTGKKSGRLLAKLAGAQSLGARPLPRDTSHDRGYLTEPDMAEAIVKGWGSLVRYIDGQRAQGNVDGEYYLRFLYSVAEQSEDPYAGELYGQARVLAYAQADERPRMLLDLAKSLAKAGYSDDAEKALVNYLEIAQTTKALMFDEDHDSQSVHVASFDIGEYLEAASFLPTSKRLEVVKDLFRRWNYLDAMAINIEGIFADQLEEGTFQFTSREKEELKGTLARGYTGLDTNTLDRFTRHVFARATNLPKAKKSTSSPDDWTITTRDAKRIVRVELLDAYAENIANTVRILASLKRLEVPAEGATISAMTNGEVASWERDIRALPQIQRRVMEEKWGNRDIPIDIDAAIVRRFPSQYPDAYLDSIQYSFFSHYARHFFEVASPETEGVPYFDVAMQLIDQEPITYAGMRSIFRYCKKELTPRQRLRVYRKLRSTLEALADLELADPGRSWRPTTKLKDWQLQKLEQSRRVTSIRVRAPHLVSTERNQLPFYNREMLGLAVYALSESDSALKAFGRECLALAKPGHEAFIGWEPSDRAKGFGPLSMDPEHGLLCHPDIDFTDKIFDILDNKFPALYAASPTDAIGLMNEIARSYEHYEGGAFDADPSPRTNHRDYFRPHLVRAAYNAAVVRELSWTRRFVELAEQCEAATYLPAENGNLFHLYQHTREFLEWHDLVQGGDLAVARERADAFLGEMRTDLAGRVNYRADELLSLARMTATIPEMGEKAELIYEQAIDRYVHRFGEERASDDKIDSREIVEAVHETPNLSDTQKDRLLARLVDGMAGLIGVDERHLQLFFDTAMGIATYLDSNRYPQTDRCLYRHGSRLAQMLPIAESRINPCDIIAGVSFLATHFLCENPWLRDPTARVTLSSTSDWRYLRELAALFPGQATPYAPPVLPTGKLNCEPAAEGFVDLGSFVSEITTRLDSGTLCDTNARNAVRVATLGALAQADGTIQGGINDVRTALPILEPIFARVEEGLASGASLSPGTHACLEGLVEGLDGDSLSYRTAFYAELLRHDNVPIEIKRRVWQHLKNAYVISPYVDNQHKRYALPSTGTISENWLYRIRANVAKWRREAPPRYIHSDIDKGTTARSRFFCRTRKMDSTCKESSPSGPSRSGEPV